MWGKKKREAAALERQQMAQSLGLLCSERDVDDVDWLAYTLPSRMRRFVGDVVAGRFCDHDVELFDLWTQRPPKTLEPAAGVSLASYAVEHTVVIVGLAGAVDRVMLTPRHDWRGLRSDSRLVQVTGNDWLDAMFTVEARNPSYATVLDDPGFAYAASQLPYPSTIELTQTHLVCAHWVLPIDEQANYLRAAVLLAEAVPPAAFRPPSS